MVLLLVVIAAVLMLVELVASEPAGCCTLCNVSSRVMIARTGHIVAGHVSTRSIGGGHVVAGHVGTSC